MQICLGTQCCECKRLPVTRLANYLKELHLTGMGTTKVEHTPVTYFSTLVYSFRFVYGFQVAWEEGCVPVIGNENNVFSCTQEVHGINLLNDFDILYNMRIGLENCSHNFLPYGPEKYLLLVRFRTLGASRAA